MQRRGNDAPIAAHAIPHVIGRRDFDVRDSGRISATADRVLVIITDDDIDPEIIAQRPDERVDWAVAPTA